jgi:low temperature requirement protein LtrA
MRPAARDRIIAVQGPAADEAVRVTTLELFFDLVFVFTITQLATVLVHEPNARGVGQVVLMLLVIWWMYGGYAWLTNSVPPTSPDRRLMLLAGMASYLILALAIPRAFGEAGTAFGIAYLAVVAVHTALFLRASTRSVARAILQIAPFNAVTAGIVLAGGMAGGTAQWVLWAIAGVGEWLTGIFTGDEGFVIRTEHFVERHGLVVIVALGESVVAIGIGASHLPVDLALAGIAVLGLLLAACLWCFYFGGDEDAAERALAAAPQRRRPSMALAAFGYWHLPILFGIIAVAAALKVATAHPSHELEAGLALFLGGGVAIYLLGDVLFRRALGLGPLVPRAAVAIVALASIPLGLEVSAVAQIGALVALLGGALSLERGAATRAARRSR